MGTRRYLRNCRRGVGNKLDVIMLPKVDGPWDIPLSGSIAGATRGAAPIEEANSDPRHSRNCAGRKQCGSDRNGLPPHAWCEPWARRPRRVTRDEDHARRRRPSRIQSAGGRARQRDARGRPGSRTSGIIRLPKWWMPARRRASSRCMDRSGTSPTRPPARCNSAMRFLWVASGPGRCIHRRSRLPRKYYSPTPRKWPFAKQIVAAMPDGAGAVMIDGKMQDDATWKQAKVLSRSRQAGRRQGPGDGQCVMRL